MSAFDRFGKPEDGTIKIPMSEEFARDHYHAKLKKPDPDYRDTILSRDPRGFVLVDPGFGNSWSNPAIWWKETPAHQDETKYKGYRDAKLEAKPSETPFLSYE